MNDNLNKNMSKLDKLKRTCKEQLWLVFLLAPLLVVAMLVGQHFHANESVSVKTKHRMSAAMAAAVELSSTELATIVAKPLTELLIMEVYSDTAKRGQNLVRVSSLDGVENVGNKAYSQRQDIVVANHAIPKNDRHKGNKVKESS